MNETSIVTISPKFQIVIPKKIRQMMKLKTGEKIQMIQYDNRIELIPIVAMRKLKGFLRGMNVTMDRETDRL